MELAKDKYGFEIWTDEARRREFCSEITFEQLLLTSIDNSPFRTAKEYFGCDFTVGEDEEIHAYKYGGVLAERGGWFVVNKNSPYKILRAKATWMS